jgi:hypothetical protein
MSAEMNRGTWVWDRAAMKMVPAAQFYAKKARGVRRSDTIPCPGLISDMKQPIISQADGRIYSDNRRYRDSLKAHGCEIIGNEKVDRPRKRNLDVKKGVGEAVNMAYEKLRSETPKRKRRRRAT